MSTSAYPPSLSTISRSLNEKQGIHAYQLLWLRRRQSRHRPYRLRVIIVTTARPNRIPVQETHRKVTLTAAERRVVWRCGVSSITHDIIPVQVAKHGIDCHTNRETWGNPSTARWRNRGEGEEGDKAEKAKLEVIWTINSLGKLNRVYLHRAKYRKVTLERSHLRLCHSSN